MSSVTEGTNDMPRKTMRFLNKYDGRSGGGCCVASPLWNGITCKNSSYISTTPSVLPACWNSQNPQLTRFSNTADICFKSPLGFRGFFPFANPPLLTDDSLWYKKRRQTTCHQRKVQMSADPPMQSSVPDFNSYVMGQRNHGTERETERDRSLTIVTMPRCPLW